MIYYRQRQMRIKDFSSRLIYVVHHTSTISLTTSVCLEVILRNPTKLSSFQRTMLRENMQATHPEGSDEKIEEEIRENEIFSDRNKSQKRHLSKSSWNQVDSPNSCQGLCAKCSQPLRGCIIEKDLQRKSPSM